MNTISKLNIQYNYMFTYLGICMELPTLLELGKLFNNSREMARQNLVKMSRLGWIKYDKYSLDSLTFLRHSDTSCFNQEIKDHFDGIEKQQIQVKGRYEGRKHTARRGKGHPNSRSIYALLDGEIVEKFNCIADAARHLNVSPQSISNILTGCVKKTRHGYTFKYAEAP